MKKALYLLAAFGILAGIIVGQQARLKRFRTENRTLNANLSVLMEGVRLYQTKDSLHAASVGKLELKLSEYRQWRQEDTRLIESLNIKLSRMQRVSRHATESGYRIAVPVRDTVFVYRERPDTVRRFSYRSPYIDLQGALRRDSVEMAFTTYDTLLQVVHRVPRRFLFIRYGTKAIRQEVVSKNPHTEITYTEYIELKK